MDQVWTVERNFGKMDLKDQGETWRQEDLLGSANLTGEGRDEFGQPRGYERSQPTWDSTLDI